MALEDQLADFLTNRQHVNNVVEVINQLKVDNKESKNIILALENVFHEVLKRRDFSVDQTLKITNPKVYEVEYAYASYLMNIYDKTWEKLVSMLNCGQADVRQQAISSAMNLMATESRYPISSTNSFPIDKLKAVLGVILVRETEHVDLVDLMKPFLVFRDISFYTWAALNRILEEIKVEADAFTSNVLSLIECMSLQKTSQYFGFNDSPKLKFNRVKISKRMQEVWKKLINFHLSAKNHRRLLIILLEGFLSTLPKPSLFTDFFIASIGMGGAISLLALQGMSTLVLKHNLECPDIFGKLYNLFEPGILHTKYKSRLFFLADLFLQSSYVSERLVAAFVKRVSRLSLIAQAPDLVVMLHFVGNMLIRHPALSMMVHHSVGGQVDEDPFDAEERDPLKSRAMESSLWELSLHKQHVQPTVANAAKFLDSNMPAVEWDLREDLDASYSQLFTKEIKRNKKAAPSLTFIRPSKIANLSDDRLYKLWSLI